MMNAFGLTGIVVSSAGFVQPLTARIAKKRRAAKFVKKGFFTGVILIIAAPTTINAKQIQVRPAIYLVLDFLPNIQ